AGHRGVAVRVVTSSGQARPFMNVAHRWPSNGPGTLRATEIVTDLSPLGSHAKVFVADREHGYVGSANITGAGLGRHVEVGVEVSGPQIGEFVRVLVALERTGTSVLVAGPDRR
ncbi:MAG TPA: phospholipase D-like domain-containing protein, partial [Chloroflexota bacterium]|nr:phospholipase D-like domain-containing protein [Chloroflexota bacterium]